MKPGPVSTAEKLPGGWGIMADDVLGGLMTNLILQGISRIF
jgi:phosphatidylglycerophosphatase A